MSIFSFLLVLVLLTNATAICCQCFTVEAEAYKIRSESAKSRIPKKRKLWSNEEARFSDRIFYRLFRMPHVAFHNLCHRIEKTVGSAVFKSEKYLLSMKKQGHSNRINSMYCNSCAKNGDYICGEMKVVLTLRYLGGASYLDLYAWLNIEPNYIITLAKKVCREWFCNNEVININIYKDVLNNVERLNQITHEFSQRSDGAFLAVLELWMVGW